MQILLSLLLAFNAHAYAEEVLVERISDGTRIESLLNEAVTRATADIQGKGTVMQLTYSSPSPLHVLVLLTNSDGNFSPEESLVVTLPAGTRKQAEVTLSKSSGWSPGNRSYRLHFLSTTNEGASFEDIEFLGTGVFDTLEAALAQLTTPLPFGPTSYHRLPSYALLGIPLIPILGLVVTVLTIGFLVARKPRKALACIVLVVLATELRFSMDAVSYGISHTGTWLKDQTYSTAGSLPAIGKELIKQNATGAYLCTTGTSYARRILGYHSYPVRITTDNPSHAVVHASTDWSYELGVLRCGNDSFRARKVRSYPNGDLLFSVLKS